MAEYKGTIECNNQVDDPRTGAPECDKTEGKTSAIGITGRNALYPTGKEAFMQAIRQSVSATDALKLYPVKNVVGVAISGGDINAPEVGSYGGPSPINLNVKNEAFQVDAGDCSYKELMKLNKRKMRLFRLDDEGALYGTIVTQGDKEYRAGFLVTLYVIRKRTDGSTANNLSLFAYYTPNNEMEEKNMFSVNIGELPDGLMGVTLEPGADGSRVVLACSGDDITTTYSGEWSPDMFINKAGVSPTTVTFNAATGALTIAPLAEYKVAPAKVLEAGEIIGYDGINAFVTITA